MHNIAKCTLLIANSLAIFWKYDMPSLVFCVFKGINKGGIVNKPWIKTDLICIFPPLDINSFISSDSKIFWLKIFPGIWIIFTISSLGISSISYIDKPNLEIILSCIIFSIYFFIFLLFQSWGLWRSKFLSFLTFNSFNISSKMMPILLFLYDWFLIVSLLLNLSLLLQY